MLKYFLGFLLLTISSVLITSQYEHYADNATPHSQSGSEAPLIGPNAPHAAGNAEQAKRDHPRWHGAYEFFGWPSGIGVWGLFLTLLAIIDQSRHTARSAKSSRDAIVLQHRPKVVLRGIRLNMHVEGGFDIDISIRNSGSTVATLRENTVDIVWSAAGQIDVRTMSVEAMKLKPGEQRIFNYAIPDFHVRFKSSLNILSEHSEQPQTVDLGCIALLSYEDEIGTNRTLAIHRLYDFRKGDWIVNRDHPEADYSD